jgi:hypothetical protein
MNSGNRVQLLFCIFQMCKFRDDLFSPFHLQFCRAKLLDMTGLPSVSLVHIYTANRKTQLIASLCSSNERTCPGKQRQLNINQVGIFFLFVCSFEWMIQYAVTCMTLNISP